MRENRHLFNKKTKKAEKNAVNNQVTEDIYLKILKSLHSYIFNETYTITPVNETKYNKLSKKELIKKFENPKFYALSKKDILELCSEVNIRVAKQLKIAPSNLTYRIDTSLSDFMSCAMSNNTIYIYSTLFLLNCDGLTFLSCLLHETLHSYQINMIEKIKNYNEFNKNIIIETMQYVGNGIKLSYAENNNKDIKSFSEHIYDVDLSEIQANLFTFNLMNEYYGKQIIQQKLDFNIMHRANEMIRITSNFTDSNILKQRNNIRKLLTDLKKSFNKNYDLLTDDEKNNMSKLLNAITLKDVDDYYSKLQNQIRKIKTETYFNVKNMPHCENVKRLKTFLDNQELIEYTK